MIFAGNSFMMGVPKWWFPNSVLLHLSVHSPLWEGTFPSPVFFSLIYFYYHGPWILTLFYGLQSIYYHYLFWCSDNCQFGSWQLPWPFDMCSLFCEHQYLALFLDFVSIVLIAFEQYLCSRSTGGSKWSWLVILETDVHCEMLQAFIRLKPLVLKSIFAFLSPPTL